MKRTIVLVISLLLIASLAMAGCSKGEDKPAAEDTGKTGEASEGTKEAGKDAPEAGAEPEVIKLRAFQSSFGEDPSNTGLYKAWLEKMEAHIGKKLDIEWTYVHSDDYPEKLKLQLASGDVPDILSGTKDAEIMFQFGNQGALLDIAPYIDEYAPNYKKFLESTQYAEKTLQTPEGKMFFFGDGFQNDTGMVDSAYGSLYRFDIFKKHNIKVPESWEEFYDAAVKLKELYPDVYPVNAQEWPPFHETFYYTNHTKGDIYWNGEKFVYGPTEEAFKEGIMYVHRMYKEKLLDPEFLTQSQDQLKQKVTTGKSFMIPFAWLGWWEQYSIPEQGIEWGAAILPKNEKYGEPWMQGAALPGLTAYPNYGTMISAKTKYPEIMVQLLDYQYSPEMIDLMTWGIEGMNYEVKDGKRVRIMDPSEEVKNAKLEWYGEGVTRQGFVFAPQNHAPDVSGYKDMPFYGKGQYESLNPFVGTGKFHSGKSAIPTWDLAPVIRLSKEDEAKKAQVMTAVKTYLDENLSKFILGERNFDEWSAFQDELTKIGDYQSIVDSMNELAIK